MTLGKIYVGNNIVADGKAIANALGSEADLIVSYSGLVDQIIGDKEYLVTLLAKFDIQASSSSTLYDLISLVNTIPVAKIKTSATIDISDISFLDSYNISVTGESTFNTPLSKAPSETYNDITFLDSMTLSDSVNTQLT